MSLWTQNINMIRYFQFNMGQLLIYWSVFRNCTRMVSYCSTSTRQAFEICYCTVAWSRAEQVKWLGSPVEISYCEHQAVFSHQHLFSIFFLLTPLPLLPQTPFFCLPACFLFFLCSIWTLRYLVFLSWPWILPVNIQADRRIRLVAMHCHNHSDTGWLLSTLTAAAK